MPIHKIIKKNKCDIGVTMGGEDYAIGYVDIRYLCNQAVGTTPSKSSYFWRNVTCKNCLQRKRGIKGTR